MDKMKMETANKTLEKLEILKEMFPEVITETKDANGDIVSAVDAKKLEQLLSTKVIEGDECYDFTWVGKKQAMVEANRPIRKTLRPCKEESVDWENTENLYIEGDNLDVLKLLQESYLNKVKMIYIDPPYNTGKDSFIYPDDYTTNKDLYDEEVGAIDESGYRMFKNTETNGRFHSSWCSMIYPRLKLARNLLSEDGVIFISIDDNEVDTLRKICSEIFGEENFIAQISNINNPKGRSDDKFVATAHEYILIYAKNVANLSWYGFEPTEEITKRYNKVDDNGRKYREIDLRKTGENDLREDRPNLFYYFYYNELTKEFYPSREDKVLNGFIQIKPQREDGREGNWRWGLETASKQISGLLPKFMPTRKIWGIMEKDYLDGRDLVKPTSSWTFKDVNSERGSEEFIELNFDKRVFPKPKPVGTIFRCAKLSTIDEDTVLDFFSGSATTAHAVMQLNAEDGGKRKFIMVQLPEVCDEKSEAYKAGYKNICEIGKERIRRAGKKIKEETGKTDLDIGFRVLKLGESNMKDVYYAPSDYNQSMLDKMTSNIKEDRTPEDLLYACMLEWGLELSLPHKVENIAGYNVHIVNDGDLIACFDNRISEEAIKQIADKKPLRAVFRDSSFATDASRVNVGEIFKLKSPNTTIKVI
ncbi:MAG: site-specific DNA-methyltransferase [Alphaproteobacteria bacterium]|nr:site-specific DNA-methyltransferase [Alphaproteobacteria bacterium]